MSSPRDPQRLEVISIQHRTTLMEALTCGWKLKMNSAERKQFKYDRFQLVSKVDSKVPMDGSSACWVLQRNGLWRTELWSCEVWWVLMLVLCLSVWTVVHLPQDLPHSISVILGFDTQDCGPDLTDSGPPLPPRPTQRPDACSNGHLRETSSHNSCKVAFIS